MVYSETLDDPEGIVHIRDLLAYMTARAQADTQGQRERKKPLPAGLDLRAVDLALPLAEAQVGAQVALRSSIDAGAGPAGPDAGDAN